MRSHRTTVVGAPATLSAAALIIGGLVGCEGKGPVSEPEPAAKTEAEAVAAPPKGGGAPQAETARGAEAARDEKALAQEILAATGITGGLVVHIGCGDGRLTAALHAADSFLVHGLDADARKVDDARAHIRSRGLYGKVSVDRLTGTRLPYADNLVNLVASENLGAVSMDEVRRVLCPRGVAYVKTGGAWSKTVKPRPAGMDEWTHYLHGPDGNPVAHDAVVGPPERLQWVGSPRWARHHDHMASMTSLVAAGGRLFYIFDEGSTASIQLPDKWRLIARDAFNGTVLWKRKIDRWNTRQYPLKSGPAHLLRRLVAVGDRVYVTLGLDAPVSVLDAATGRDLVSFEGSQYTREIVVSGGVVFLVADKAPSKLPEWRRLSTYVWDNTGRANPGWGWRGDSRRLLACRADSGEQLWQAEFPVAPCSLAVAIDDGRLATGGPGSLGRARFPLARARPNESEGGEGEDSLRARAASSPNPARLVFCDGQKLVCLDRTTGAPVWQTEPEPIRLPVTTNTGPRVLIYKNVVLFAGNTGRMAGFSIETGKKLWEARHRPSGHMSLKDLFVADGLVWTAAIANSSDDGVFAGYDPVTGEVKKEFAPDVKVQWFHHRCYPSKATQRFLLTGRNGTEFVDLAAEHWKPHHWVRGGCIYGVLPCNGMLYAPMHSCGCQLEAKLTGFNALAPGPVPLPEAGGPQPEVSGEARLERGPAYGQVDGPAAGPADWPTYRHDGSRSGATPAAVPSELKQAWSCELGGRLSPPTAAAGKIFVSSVDTHTLHALDAPSGRLEWSYTTGGRIDSPPTYHRGLVLFGSTDGWVYALRAADGQLAWRFRAAPMDRRVVAWEQLESAWPVHGSVLVAAGNDRAGVLYCTAGRSMFLDGGIRLVRLDPATGRLLGEVVMDGKDPESGKDMHMYVKGMNMAVGLSDILSSDGAHIYMRSQKMDLEGNRLEIAIRPVTEQGPDGLHMFCQVGFLDDSWFFRSYWTYGRRVTGGYGGWFQAGRLVPAGRILAADDACVYGYGRKPEYMVNSSVLEYQLFAAEKAVTREAITRTRRAGGRMNARLYKRNANSSDWRLRRAFPTEDLTAARFRWTLEQPAVMGRALVAAGDTVFLAGPPAVVDERRAFHLPDEAGIIEGLARQAEALEGAHGGQLWAVSKKDGRPTARYELDTIPVFDGLAAAEGRLYMSTVDGRVLCLAADGAALRRTDKATERTRVLPSIGGPLHVRWDKPEDPDYLLPPPVPKEKDFDKITRCTVIASDLGYRLRARARRRVGTALKRLDAPLTGTVTLRTRMKAVPKAGLPANGYLAFGDAADETRLVKCGVQMRNRQARLVQGPLRKGQVKAAKIKVSQGKEVAVTVVVDLGNGRVAYTAGGVTVEAELRRRMESVTHIGYCTDSGIFDFAPIETDGR